MVQLKIWENEYRNPKLVTLYNRPQSFFLKFLKFLKKDLKFSLDKLSVLDLGSGTGRNSNYLAEKGASVAGIEISETAIKLAKKRVEKGFPKISYIKQSIGNLYPFSDNNFDLILDITSSNSLNENERKIYLSETKRVLKKGGIFFVRALCKDGDKNAKFLLKNNPGKEKDTYIMPVIGLVERVFSKEDLIKSYSRYFKILKIEKTKSYSVVGGRKFKRSFWLVTCQK